MTVDMEDIVSTVSDSQHNDIKEFMKEEDVMDWTRFSMKFQRKHKYCINKNMIRHVYISETGKRAPRSLIKKAARSQYGILNVCVFTSAYPEYTDEEGVRQKQDFSCKHNCYFCPSEHGQPRSYLKKEPGVARANDCDFDCVRQFHMRLSQYKGMGHFLDKIEFEVSGGTWSEYPREYQNEFIRDGYYAANTYGKPTRERLSLEEEIILNETNEIHIIGLTIETRPDSINLSEISTFRMYNVTRVQMGLQHTDNKLLRKINRGHTIEDSMNAIRMLLDNGFKVDVHLMPMLPGATPSDDDAMFDRMLTDERLQVDQWKVYPCSVVPWSVLESWYKTGKYKPYTNEELFEVLSNMKHKVHNRIRLIRIVRDINDEYILGGCSVSHMRQLLQNKFKDICKCIRCRSAKDDRIDPKYKLRVDQFRASDGFEFFISFVSNDEKVLYGFCRLRLPSMGANRLRDTQLPVLKDRALIRELHVYSTMTPVNGEHTTNIQHRGFGKKLMKTAEEIASLNGYRSYAVISGVGVRNYYRKMGYQLMDTYMVKSTSLFEHYKNVVSAIIQYTKLFLRSLWR
jgi:ELP3 family radical SAM enzyme/protein acetyltransferase